LGFPESQRSDADEAPKEETEQRSRIQAPNCSTLCGKDIGKGSSGHEETSCPSCYETSKDFEKITGTSKGQTSEGRSH